MKATIQLPLFITLLFLIQSCGPEQQTAQQESIQEYPVTTIVKGETIINTEYPATIEGQQNIEIRSKVDGFVAQIFVDEGAAVKKGQLLFRINAPQYEQEVRTASAAIKNADAEVNTAKMQVEKTLPLVREGIVSEYELKLANFNLHAKEAALLQARAGLANARTNLGYTAISSPADGVVGSIPYKTGSLVSSTSVQPLTTVSNIAHVFAYFSFNEKQFLDFTDSFTGKNMKEKLKHFPAVTLLLANGAEYKEKGRMESIGGLINTETGAVNLRAGFPNPEGIIRSGASATIRIPLQVKDALLIPAKATYEMQEKLMAVTVNKDGTVKVTEIEVMDSPAGEFYVVKKGLNAGDHVVIEGMGGLKDGTKIKPVFASKLSAAKK
ncbi:membrane fusion protein (multidrug efflux system) [Pedobacter sp. AK017]|uniref:efflux RND transporter periplasmic adaptor subunit n=1 Tax=Pedobacter sp. AK017 TaxID=2723073 RepID=UPI00182B1EC2|nr:efflux RND transporter periplasmic adaptor subunit [Pedobacter sp. AK017]MBB5439058.1 membrane fusion protein (multidrug efflux system) [Pedobacter sp. AK017]